MLNAIMTKEVLLTLPEGVKRTAVSQWAIIAGPGPCTFVLIELCNGRETRPNGFADCAMRTCALHVPVQAVQDFAEYGSPRVLEALLSAILLAEHHFGL